MHREIFNRARAIEVVRKPGLVGFFSAVRTLSVAFLALFGFSLSASAQVTLPDVGIDMPAYVTAFGAGYGAVVAVIIGLAFAFMVIWAALRKSRRSTG